GRGDRADVTEVRLAHSVVVARLTDVGATREGAARVAAPGGPGGDADGVRVDVAVDAELRVPSGEHVQGSQRGAHAARGDEGDEEAVVAVHLHVPGLRAASAEGGVGQGDRVGAGAAAGGERPGAGGEIG